MGGTKVKAFKNIFPVILLILFELAVGILLMIKPDEFTSWVIKGFGAILLLYGLIYFIRFFIDKKNGEQSVLTMIFAVVAIIIGAVSLIFTEWLKGLFAVMFVIYAIFLIIAGIFKIKIFIDARKARLPAPFISLLSAFLSIALGVFIILDPVEALRMSWILVGVAFIIEAVVDIIALIVMMGPGKPKPREE